MSNSEIQTSIEAILADPTKTPLYGLLGLPSTDYRREAIRIIKSAIALHEPRAVVTAVEFNGGVRVKWQSVLTTDIRSEPPDELPDKPPDTSTMKPQDAIATLVQFSIVPYLGKANLLGIEGEIQRTVERDNRFKVLETRSQPIPNGYELEVPILSSVPLIRQLKYDGVSKYDGTWSYKEHT